PAGEMRPGRVRPAGETRPGGVSPARPERQGGVRPSGSGRSLETVDRSTSERTPRRDTLRNLANRSRAMRPDSLPKERSVRVENEVVYDSIFVYETDLPTPSISLIIGD